jgi:hypothetical protein
MKNRPMNYAKKLFFAFKKRLKIFVYEIFFSNHANIIRIRLILVLNIWAIKKKIRIPKISEYGCFSVISDRNYEAFVG